MKKKLTSIINGVRTYGFGIRRVPKRRQAVLTGYSEGSAPLMTRRVKHVDLDTASIIRNGDYGPDAMAFMSSKSLARIVAATPSAEGIFPES